MQLLPNNDETVKFWQGGREEGGEEGGDFSLLKGQIKAITPFFVIATRNRTVNINLYFIEATLTSCSVAENTPHG